MTMRINVTILRIATLFVRQPKRPLWARFMERKLGINAGTLFSALQRMVAAGWLTSHVEPAPPNEFLPLRPQRRLYRITELGLTETRRALSDLQVPPLQKAASQ